MSEPIDLDVIEPDDMGIIMDALIEHAASSRKRKGVNSESLSDERAERCDYLILLVGRAITATTVAGLRAQLSGGTVTYAENQLDRIEAAISLAFEGEEAPNV